MRTSELKSGRKFAVTFDHGEDFMSSLARFCRDNGGRQGYIPMFLAGFAEADIARTCEKLDNPDPCVVQGPREQRRGPRMRHYRPRRG
jgi:hypothetical protein